MHGAHALVRAENGAEEAAAQVEFRDVGLDGELRGLPERLQRMTRIGLVGETAFGLRMMMRTFWSSRLMVRYSPELMVALL